MPDFGVQQAITSAVFGGDSNLDNFISATSDAANFQQRVQGLLPDRQITTAALVGTAIVGTAAAVAGITYLIVENLETVEKRRQNFKAMVQRHATKFFVLDSGREGHGDYVAEAVRLLEESYPTLFTMSGLKRRRTVQDEHEGTELFTFYAAALDYFNELEQPREDGDDIDEAIQALRFLFGGDFQQLLIKVRANIKDEFLNNISLFFDGADHVQWINSTRLIIMLVANIALCITQGVKPNSRYPLTLPELKDLCNQLRSYLISLRGIGANQILKTNLSSLCEHELFDKCLARAVKRVNTLELAYNNKLKYDLNLPDVVSSGYALLQNATRPLRRLLFSNGSLEDPALFFSDLIKLQEELALNPDLLERLLRKHNLKNFNTFERQLNSTLCTVMDLLALYASNHRSKREDVLEKLLGKSSLGRGIKHPEYQDFVDILTSFDRKYIHPIEEITESYGTFGGANKTAINPAGYYLICFVSLMLEAHNVTLLDRRVGFLSSNEQAAAFLKQAYAADGKYRFAYFHENGLRIGWNLYIKELINLVYGVRHLSHLTTLTQTNERYLQLAEFQAFINKHLQKLTKNHEDFIRVKEQVILQGQVSGKQDTEETLIASEINSKVPHKNTQMPELSIRFSDSITRAERVINQSVFDELNAANERALIARISSYDLSVEDAANGNSQFYQSLHACIFPATLSLDALDRGELPEFAAREFQTDISFTNNQPVLNSSFWLKALDVALAVSITLLLLGLMILLISSYVETVSLLPIAAQSALLIAGYVSIGTGGVGLVSNCVAPRFFSQKDQLLALDAGRDDLIYN